MLLSEEPYSLADEWESEEVDKYKKRMYNWDDLINKVQASDDELKAGLQALSAVEIDGFWRVVDEKYMDSMLQMLLHNTILNDWSLDALDEGVIMRVMKMDSFPEKLVQHCLHVYGDKLDGNEGKGCLWRLDEKQVCVHFAREVLRKGKMKLEHFMDEWRQKIPLGMRANFDMLEGEVLTERLGVETWVRGFRVCSLPLNPAERFTILFKERPKWEWKDLQPYIRFVCYTFLLIICYLYMETFNHYVFYFQGSYSSRSFFRRFASQIHPKNSTEPRSRSCVQCKID